MIATEESPKSQFSITAIFVLTLAIAVWFWIFNKSTPGELTILTSIVLGTGFVSHFVQVYLLSWRFTAILFVIATYNLILLLLTLVHVQSATSASLSHSIRLIKDVVVAPVEMMSYASTTSEFLSMSPILLATLLFSPAHSIRPSLPTAIVTAIGIGIWYSAGLMILTHAA